METEYSSKKILGLASLSVRLNEHRSSGKIVVFTNGCFDILHAGHVAYLTAAGAEGDLLVVGLNSDRSVGAIKGKDLPIIPEKQRAAVLAGLACVSYVTIFEDPDPYRLIQAVRPDVLVKGADWKADEIIGADVVENLGGRVVRIPFTVDISTSKIIDRIKSMRS